jgi:fumarate hydratase class I
MPTADLQQIKQKITDSISAVGYVLDDSMCGALQGALCSSTHENEIDILSYLIGNVNIASGGDFPLCQDTGLVVFWVKIGSEISMDFVAFEKILSEAVSDSFESSYYRNSVVQDPISRKISSQKNSPPIIHYEHTTGTVLEAYIMLKGGGSENMSTLKMLNPADGIDGVKDFVLQTIKKSGGNACPPLTVGVGIGGNFETCATLAKKSLFRDIHEHNSDKYWHEQEISLLAEINKLGIGALGFGGSATALKVNIEVSPCHIATLPVAVNLECHAHRVIKINLLHDKQENISGKKAFFFRGQRVSQEAHHINLPLSTHTISTLKKGDAVKLTGRVYTARDSAHQRMIEYIDSGRPLPFAIEKNPIFYCGPTPAKQGFPIGACGPTTSGRMDKYVRTLFTHGLRCMIGKGERNDDVKRCISEYGGIYLIAIGGAGALYANTVVNSRCVAWEDLGAEAVYEIDIRNFPCFVGWL